MDEFRISFLNLNNVENDYGIYDLYINLIMYVSIYKFKLPYTI